MLGVCAVPALAATGAGVNPFASEAVGQAGEPLLVSAPPSPLLFVVVGVGLVAWAVGRRHLKSLADLSQAQSVG